MLYIERSLNASQSNYFLQSLGSAGYEIRIKKPRKASVCVLLSFYSGRLVFDGGFILKARNVGLLGLQVVSNMKATVENKCSPTV